jgi:hypothetical protein
VKVLAAKKQELAEDELLTTELVTQIDLLIFQFGASDYTTAADIAPVDASMGAGVSVFEVLAPAGVPLGLSFLALHPAPRGVIVRTVAVSRYAQCLQRDHATSTHNHGYPLSLENAAPPFLPRPAVVPSLPAVNLMFLPPLTCCCAAHSAAKWSLATTF